MLPCQNGPKTRLKQFSNVENMHEELTILIHICKKWLKVLEPTGRRKLSEEKAMKKDERS